MTKVPTPVSGNPDSKGEADGVSDSPGGARVHGRSSGGESGGGAYPNPNTGKTPTSGGFLGHGGQTEMEYHGGGQGGENGTSAPNAVTGSSGEGDTDGSSGVPTAEHKDRHIAGGTIAVEETSGVAEAEAAGKVGTDAPYEEAQKQPGSG